MHFQLLQSAALLALAIPTALGGSVHQSLHERESWPIDTEPIDLTKLGTFNAAADSQSSNPNELVTRELEERSSFSAQVCRDRKPNPRSGGPWLFREATCDRNGSPYTNKFKVSCQAGNQHADINYRNPGSCYANEVCIEFYGYSDLGAPAWDVFCLTPSNVHRWVLNSQASSDQTACSPGWTNSGKTSLTATFETDVLDSAGSSRIAPKEIFYKLNGSRIGKSAGNDPDVASGEIVVPRVARFNPASMRLRVDRSTVFWVLPQLSLLRLEPRLSVSSAVSFGTD